ncbi:hypothetical protein POM88_024115 [Heracleum sosnowskyi]|uniref:F-box domain-containing protein n=1 Tax=Heracleum sosnowskyi TaxID=360622 RepID=A0AAD8ILZ3_9APIA|nr:hypothetical protein POM88_024115 [Heracleum sosnowskyi]
MGKKQNAGGERLKEEDLLIEVLSRLDVRTLLVCKAVSKTWHSLISSPTLVKCHLSRAITSSSSEDNKETALIVRLFNNEEDNSFSLYHLGGCDDNVAHLISSYWLCLRNWFGFDPIDFDFKVVRVLSKDMFPEVYSLNKNVWHNIETRLSDIPYRHRIETCLHGFLFAIGHNGMMAFDLNKEVFICDISLPVPSNDTCVTDFKDSVAVIIFNFSEKVDRIKLWTLDDEACLRGVGVKASWTMMLTIDVGVRVDWVYGIFNSVELLLASGEWFLYNLDKKVGRYIDTDLFFDFHEVFKYILLSAIHTHTYCNLFYHLTELTCDNCVYLGHAIAVECWMGSSPVVNQASFQLHFGCDWVTLDMTSTSSAQTKAASGNSSNVISAFALILSVIALCISVSIGYAITRNNNTGPFIPMDRLRFFSSSNFFRYIFYIYSNVWIQLS